MNPPPRSEDPSRSAFTLRKLLIGIVALAVLATLAVSVSHNGSYIVCQMTGTMSNARQLCLAMRTESLDTRDAGGGGPEWTSLVDAQGRTSPATFAQFCEAFVKNGYLTEDDLRKLLTAPGKGPGSDAPTAQNSCFKFFAVDNDSPADQPMIVTANWDNGRLTDAMPYGKKGFLVFTKSGSGGFYSRASDASSPSVFPVGKDAHGHAYRYEVLK